MKYLFILGLLAALGLAQAETVKNHKIPVIFAHGFLVPAMVYDDFSYIRTIFRAKGFTFLVAQTPVNKTLEERADILNEEIKRLVPEGPFHLIGHSMGGLDARLAIHKYNLGERCISLTTVATPHHGTMVAHWANELLAQSTHSKDEKPNTPETQNPYLRELQVFYRDTMNGMQDLTPEFVEGVFNQRVKDDPRVRYFSLSFYTPWPFYLYSSQYFLAPTHELLLTLGQDNDGLVSVESSRWGKSLGTLLGDHIVETFPGPFSGGLIYPKTFLTIIDEISTLE